MTERKREMMEKPEDVELRTRQRYSPPTVVVLGTLLELTEAGGESLPSEIIFPNSSQS